MALRRLCALPLFAGCVIAKADDVDTIKVCAESSNGAITGASKRGQAMLQGSKQYDAAVPQACDWSVYYNVWIPSFETTEYKHGGALSGAHCLESCCKDPHCQGLALKSSETDQCYRYTSSPKGLDSLQAHSLADGHWLLNNVPAWSVFVKGKAGVVEFRASEQATSPSPPLVQPSSISSKVSVQHACTWAVFYDKWIPGFEVGEYKHAHAGAQGNAHCLEACCQDPTCPGIALESSELQQCYKYRNLPSAIAKQKGVPLGDGQWLASKKNAWSVFVKSEFTVEPHTQEISDVRFGPPPVGYIGSYLAITVLVVYCFVADTFAKRLAEKFGLRKANLETKPLLGRLRS